jgi:tetratricopeptide (TPR) repeat protein
MILRPLLGILRPLLGAGALVAATLVLPAAAGTPSRGDCGAKDPQLSIAGCTLVINDPRTDASMRVRALGARAFAYNDTHDYDRAIADASRALTVKPDDALALVVRARAFKGKDDLVHALEDYDAAIKLDPRNASYYRERGDVREHAGDHDGAIADATATIELLPDDMLAHLDRAEAYQARAHGSVTDDLRKALADYDVVVRLKPDDEFLTWALNERGHVHHALGDFDAAIIDYTLQLGVDATATEANVERAKAFAAKGDFKQALADYEVALKVWPKDEKILAWRADAAAKLARTP